MLREVLLLPAGDRVMVRATDREIVIVAAYLSSGSCKGAADVLGIRPETLRHRLSRIYARHGVVGIAQLVLVVADDVRPYLQSDTDGPLVAEACCLDD